ncbi:HU family DNA-binding protein [Tabrizicola fusiformis]|uniref:HU family DNA-binding protein n=1 Tax=Tabrizicola sp. SY72 TaxID=2741673 RepID=UPI001571CE37|nr:HU family DNA-binding protein [Tabrizicola sp. SY72]NTT88243.1 HU family DNA-binding protein [Tabrizicola sp. SY72]
MGTVNKDALVRTVAEATGQQLASTKATIEAFIDAVRARTAGGDTVKLIGFGSFQTKTHKARTARNPRTGETVDVPEGQRLTFKASKVA